MRRIDSLADLFAEHGVKVVAISADDVRGVNKQLERDGLESMTLLADPELAAIDALGLRRPKGLPFKTTYLFGIPIGVPTRLRDIAIPTSILIDAEGTVRWIDQAEDYRLRSNSERIRAALEA